MAKVMTKPTIGIRQLPAERNTHCAEHHRERRQPVGPGVNAVATRPRIPMRRPNPDPIGGNDFVAGKADEAGDDHPRHLMDVMRVEGGRCTATQAAAMHDAAIVTTMNTPARSSDRPYPYV